MRDYGTGSWDGGDPDCDHSRHVDYGEKSDTNRGSIRGGPMGQVCEKCGATRVDRQLGLEASPDAYVAAMVAVFTEVRRVLADTGTLWLNLGDSYNGSRAGAQGASGQMADRSIQSARCRVRNVDLLAPGLKPKDLVGIPWRVAFALQADGWYLRSDIIWAKPNPMPESVTDRPTKAHEYVFLLSKGPRYFFDQEAVREKADEVTRRAASFRDGGVYTGGRSFDNSGANGKDTHGDGDPSTGRNVRSVWQIATQPYAEAHFATFPEELPRRCILAGCPDWVCGTCGKPRERVVDVTYDNPGNRTTNGPRSLAQRHETAGFEQRLEKRTETVGWSDCGHNDYRPGTVLDPFFGSGTTGLVARKHGRRTIGIELNPDYAHMAARRLQQLSLLA